MTTFIAESIKRAEKKNGTGLTLYRAYFINTTFYEGYRENVDMILLTDGYGQCIATE